MIRYNTHLKIIIFLLSITIISKTQISSGIAIVLKGSRLNSAYVINVLMNELENALKFDKYNCLNGKHKWKKTKHKTYYSMITITWPR